MERGPSTIAWPDGRVVGDVDDPSHAPSCGRTLGAWSLIADIQPPELEAQDAILRMRAVTTIEMIQKYVATTCRRRSTGLTARNGKLHSTVVHSVEKVDDVREEDQELDRVAHTLTGGSSAAWHRSPRVAVDARHAVPRGPRDPQVLALPAPMFAATSTGQLTLVPRLTAFSRVSAAPLLSFKEEGSS